MHIGLLRVLRSVIRADSDPARQALFANLLQARLLVRWVFWLHQRVEGTWFSTALVSAHGLDTGLRIAGPARAAKVIAVAQYANGRRQVARVMSWVGTEDCAWIRRRWSVLTIIAAGRHITWRHAVRSARVLGAIDRRYGFLVACRSADALAWYWRSRMILARARPGAVLVSSDSNPEEIGFVGAARQLGIPSIFISHAYPTPLAPPLDFTLSILEGEAAVRARLEKGPIAGDVLLAGVEGDSAPLDPQRFLRPNPVIGIFPPKALSWPTLAAIVDECRRHYQPRRIIIRWHPSMLEPRRLHYVLHDRSGIVEAARRASLDEVTRQCDWVVADENSNVHLPVLKLGIPTIAVAHLGIYPDSHADQYGFVAHRIIMPPVRSLGEVEPQHLVSFYSSEWRQRFHQYDATYLKPMEMVAKEVRDAVLALIERS